jgi:hypothetical protein
MVVCKMDVLAVGQVVGTVRVCVESACGRREAVAVCAKTKKPQKRVIVSAERLKKWPSVRVGAPSSLGSLGVRCSATSRGDDEPKKSYDLNEVIERVTHEEENQLPEEEKDTPEPLPEGEPSPFSPAIDTDDTDDQAFQGGGVSKDSLVMPPRADATQESAASSSIGEGLGVNDISTIPSTPVGGSAKSRDWRVHMSNGGEPDMDLSPSLEKASDIGTHSEHQKEMFGSSEASCDEGSSFMAEEGILEHDGGNSVDDYKLRAHIFAESDVFFSALKDRGTHSVL